MFSFLSGFAGRGEASTVVASNVTKPSPATATSIVTGTALTALSPNGTYSGTPHSRVLLLFTFSEEDSAFCTLAVKRKRKTTVADLKIALSDKKTQVSMPVNGTSSDILTLTMIAAGAMALDTGIAQR
jgi:hypothetical protein